MDNKDGPMEMQGCQSRGGEDCTSMTEMQRHFAIVLPTVPQGQFSIAADSGLVKRLSWSHQASLVTSESRIRDASRS